MKVVPVRQRPSRKCPKSALNPRRVGSGLKLSLGIYHVPNAKHTLTRKGPFGAYNKHCIQYILSIQCLFRCINLPRAWQICSSICKKKMGCLLLLVVNFLFWQILWTFYLFLMALRNNWFDANYFNLLVLIWMFTDLFCWYILYCVQIIGPFPCDYLGKVVVRFT